MDLSQSFVRVFTVRVLSLFLFLLFGTWNSAFAQQNSLIRKYFSSFENDTTNLAKAQFLVYPTLGFSPETNLEIGLSGLYLYYQNQDTSNRLSEITGRMFYTLENQYGAFVEHALYSQGNRWFFLGNFRYQNFPLSFFGVGIESPKEDEQLVSAKQFLIKERILREVKKNFYVGLELEYNRTSEVVFSKPENLILNLLSTVPPALPIFLRAWVWYSIAVIMYSMSVKAIFQNWPCSIPLEIWVAITLLGFC